MRKLLKFVDAVSEWSGQFSKWLCPLLVAVLSLEVLMRYAFGSPTTWAHLSSMMIGGSIIVLGLAYTQLHNSHIRIDVLYSKWSPRRQACVDTVMALVLLFPLLAAFTSTSFNWMMQSWLTHEVRTESFWYPPAAPFRTIIFLGWVLFAVQCAGRFVRDLQIALRGTDNK